MPLQSAYRALSDPTRRQILWMLHDGECAVGDIASRLDLPASTLRRHLGLLTAAGLLHGDGMVCALRTSVLADVVLELAELADLSVDVTRAELIERSSTRAGRAVGRRTGYPQVP